MDKHRKLILFVITLTTFPFIFFNLISTLAVPFLGHFQYTFINTLIIIELCIWGINVASSLIFYRAYCSHVCAMAGMLEMISSITHSKDIMTMRYPKISKYIMLFCWLSGFGYICLSLIGKSLQWFDVAPIYLSPVIVIYYFLFFISGLLSLTIGKSKTEHYACPFSPWMIFGMKMSSKLRIPKLAIVTDTNKCVSCKQCNKACIIEQDVHRKVLNNCFDQQECVNCFECVGKCKFGAIERKWIK